MSRILMIAVILLAGCTARPERPRPTPPPLEDRSLADATHFISAIGITDEVTVYEGLPHPAMDHEKYMAESKRSDLIWLEGYPFYSTPLIVNKDDKAKLTTIALRKDGHIPFAGYKLCGGFHPDYAIIWTRPGQKSGSLICFGCHEWKNFTPKGRIYEDLGQTTYNEFRLILTPYGTNPKSSDRNL